MFAALEGGAFARDVTESLRATIKAMREAQRVGGGHPKASIAVYLDLRLIDGVIEVLASHSSVGPKRSRPTTPFLPTPGDGLTDRDDGQTELPLKGRK